jgi:hypothetical protein
MKQSACNRVIWATMRNLGMRMKLNAEFKLAQRLPRLPASTARSGVASAPGLDSETSEAFQGTNSPMNFGARCAGALAMITSHPPAGPGRAATAMTAAF